MFLLFIKENLAWIMFYILLLLGINLLFVLDFGFSGISIGYFNIVFVIVFFVFFIWRYVKEIAQLKYFEGNITENNTIKEIHFDKLSPFQVRYIKKIFEMNEKRDNLLNSMRVKVQEDTEEVLAWVHEVKTPLTAMKLMFDQIEDYKLRNRIENEWLRLNHLLDQQLHSTRLATIEKDNRFERVLLKEIIFTQIRDFQSWCMEKGIGFNTEGLDTEVITDKKWLAFIVRQLLSNAIKYSYENTEINIYTSVDNNNHLLLHFEDKGIGISEEDLPRIFQKSFTGTIGRESAHSTGMGLYLADNAAKKLGIEISVQSILGKGSKFTLCFSNENKYIETFGR